MHPFISFLGGLVIGGSAMFFSDPVRGVSRRAVARDKLRHGGRVFASTVDVGMRDLAHRTQGLVAESWARVVPDRDLTDDVIEDRVRSRLGRVVSHPHSIQVSSDDGIVTLKGLILTSEQPALIEEVCRVRGVRDVIDRMDAHETDDHLPGLQGGVPRWQIAELRSRWTPANRFLVGVAGVTVAIFGLSRRGTFGWLGAASGALALAQSASRDTRTGWIAFPTIEDSPRRAA